MRAKKSFGMQRKIRVYWRFHIDTKDVATKIRIPPKYIITRYNNCINCQECVEACIYGVHEIDDNGMIAEPISERCRGCLSCVTICPMNAISVGINPEYLALGDSYFTPDRISTINFEAETGRIPVSGAGFGGKFSGKGFDSF